MSETDWENLEWEPERGGFFTSNLSWGTAFGRLVLGGNVELVHVSAYKGIPKNIEIPQGVKTYPNRDRFLGYSWMGEPITAIQDKSIDENFMKKERTIFDVAEHFVHRGRAWYGGNEMDRRMLSGLVSNEFKLFAKEILMSEWDELDVRSINFDRWDIQNICEAAFYENLSSRNKLFSCDEEMEDIF